MFKYKGEKNSLKFCTKTYSKKQKNDNKYHIIVDYEFKKYEIIQLGSNELFQFVLALEELIQLEDVRFYREEHILPLREVQEDVWRIEGLIVFLNSKKYQIVKQNINVIKIIEVIEESIDENIEIYSEFNNLFYEQIETHLEKASKLLSRKIYDSFDIYQEIILGLKEGFKSNIEKEENILLQRNQFQPIFLNENNKKLEIDLSKMKLYQLNDFIFLFQFKKSFGIFYENIQNLPLKILQFFEYLKTFNQFFLLKTKNFIDIIFYILK